MDSRDYSYGIYKYVDNDTGTIVYIGKDSHIDKNKRHTEHLMPSKYDSQIFNKILQNNPDRYSYYVWYHVHTVEEMNQLEFDLINLYRPKFNFHHGGCSKPIDRDFKYAVTKYGFNRKGLQKYAINDMNQKPVLQSVCFDFLKSIVLKLNNGELTLSEAKKIKRKLPYSDDDKISLSKSKNNTGFYGVGKHKCNSCKQGHIWNYSHVKNGKRIRFEKTDFFELKKEVENRKLIWRIIDIDKAIESVRSIHTGF